MEFDEKFIITNSNRKTARNKLLKLIDEYLNDEDLDATLLIQVDENSDLNEIYETYLELYNSKKISILSSKIKNDLITSIKNVIDENNKLNDGNLDNDEIFGIAFHDVDFDDISIQLANSILN